MCQQQQQNSHTCTHQMAFFKYVKIFVSCLHLSLCIHCFIDTKCQWFQNKPTTHLKIKFPHVSHDPCQLLSQPSLGRPAVCHRQTCDLTWPGSRFVSCIRLLVKVCHYKTCRKVCSVCVKLILATVSKPYCDHIAVVTDATSEAWGSQSSCSYCTSYCTYFSCS